ncbi:MAG: hypothetical protein WBD46_20595, partial [Acidobacteriaceae bacterium]
MKRYIAPMAALAALIFFYRAGVAQTPVGTVAEDYARARAIVAKMTLDEKITELHGIHTAEYYRYVPGIPRLE